ncbi:acetolactate synthase 2 catalytic subunit [Gallaecimonas kandeliae]|uniref:acetolactate synthase 2 catalytic subunit n=1 Tax=Gallaecimonas kandeliae TaxID=3029055 RepID=UPI00264761AB|nr:acetolactate synthase 2 catalytic subunit [Gallaecimonas kandeliae]WKE67465.1 acetolactate synthase 2 catalytic subunit [Gallaecimonas kandeliae]
MTGAQCLVECLQQQGVHTLFGYPGGAIMPIYDALVDAELTHVLCRHEQGAALAAIGYARASNQVGVVMATSGPGATNLITGLADAMMDSIPLVAITGQVPSNAIGSDAFQEIDVLGLSLACTKHSYLVTDPAELPAIIEEAFALAKSGKPGPVLVDIPKDVQQAAVGRRPAAKGPAQGATRVDFVALGRAETLLRSAKRPIAYVGGGIGMGNAIEELRDFLAATGMPAVETLKGLGSCGLDYEYNLGMLGMHGSRGANMAVQECDLLLVLGARFDDRVTGKLIEFAPHARVIHVDIDAAELGKRRHADVALAMDAKAALKQLARVPAGADWQAHCAAYKAEHSFSAPRAPDHIHAPWLLAELSRKAGRQARVCCDVGQHQMWVAQHMGFDHPSRHISSGGLGTMGFGLPAAIGAKLAEPGTQTLLVTGDGSIMMNIQELATVKRMGLAVKILLLDNQRLGMVRQWQSLFFDGRHSEVDLSDNPDFLTIASAFEIPGERLSHPDQVDGALDRFLAADGSYFLHVAIPSDLGVWPLVPPGKGNHQMMEA